jgi:hypothetical protein
MPAKAIRMTSANSKPPRTGRPGTPERSPWSLRAAATCDDSETELLQVLERSPHDQAVHAGIIARPHLSNALMIRLIPLLSDGQLDALFARHPLPMESRREVLKRSPMRPPWWRQALLSGRR